MSSQNYIEAVRLVGDAIDVLAASGRDPSAEGVVAVISRLGVFPLADLDVLRAVVHEIFSRTVH